MRYVLVMLGSLVGLLIVACLLLYLLIRVGCIYPANYAEQKINEAYDTILRADKVTAEMIPALCDYVIFSENGEKIGGDLSEQYEPVSYTHLDVYKRQGLHIQKENIQSVVCSFFRWIKREMLEGDIFMYL